MDSVAVFGASGFVGTTLVEHLLREGRYQVRPFINSGRNAWRLARVGLDLQRVDVLDQNEIVRAIDGCTHLVNCTMGPRTVMFEGLRNLLAASTTAGIRRFVHLSSITAYGESPSRDSVHEDAKPNPKRGSYGWIKMTQDAMVLSAAKQGLPCVVLCPPIVSGPRSTQLMWLLKCINEAHFALVDTGENPCALVDVDNLAHAIVLALDAPEPDAERMYVLDDVVPTWRELLEEMAALFEPGVTYPSLSRAQAESLIKRKTTAHFSPSRTVRHLLSPQVRQILGKDPMIASVGRIAKQVLPRAATRSRKRSASVRLAEQPVQHQPTYDLLQLSRQLRGVYHSYDRARSKLGYAPLYSFTESMARFRQWYASEKGWMSDHADLIKLLDT